MVSEVVNWMLVGEQQNCLVNGFIKDSYILIRGILELSFNIDVCDIQKLEYVQVIVSFRLFKVFRGDISIDFIFLGKMISQLFFVRRNDKDIFGLNDWVFMIVYFWDEFFKGIWILRFYYDKKFLSVLLKLDVEEREKVFI